MAYLYYAKLNVNSKIFDVYSNEAQIENILDDLFKKIDDLKEYEKVIKWYKEVDGVREERESIEKYNFSDIKKFQDGTRKYIYGKIVRRYPYFSEEFDEATRKSKKIVLENNSKSINFYFDVRNEIVTFCERKGFGYKQFLEGFKELVNLYTDVDFEVFLIKNPFSIKEHLEKVHKVTKIVATVIPPNVNEEALKSLIDESVEEMEEANITKKTSIFEHSKKNDKGINMKSKLVEKTLNADEGFRKFEVGYGKLEVEGENSDGSKFHYDSEDDSPYTTIIGDEEKNIEYSFINSSQSGITILLAKCTIDRYENS